MQAVTRCMQRAFSRPAALDGSGRRWRPSARAREAPRQLVAKGATLSTARPCRRRSGDHASDAYDTVNTDEVW